MYTGHRTTGRYIHLTDLNMSTYRIEFDLPCTSPPGIITVKLKKDETRPSDSTHDVLTTLSNLMI